MITIYTSVTTYRTGSCWCLTGWLGRLHEFLLAESSACCGHVVSAHLSVFFVTIVCLSHQSLISLSVCLPSYLSSPCLPLCLSSSIWMACREILGFLLLGCGWRGWEGLAAGGDLTLPFSLPPPHTPLLPGPSPSAVFLLSEPGPRARLHVLGPGAFCSFFHQRSPPVSQKCAHC